MRSTRKTDHPDTKIATSPKIMTKLKAIDDTAKWQILNQNDATIYSYFLCKCVLDKGLKKQKHFWAVEADRICTMLLNLVEHANFSSVLYQQDAFEAWVAMWEVFELMKIDST